MGGLANTDLSGMAPWDAAREMDSLVFTAARGWTRSIRIDRQMRDMIVAALKVKFPKPRILDEME